MPIPYTTIDTLKIKICTTTVLTLPQTDRPYTLMTDYSTVALFAILRQLVTDGIYHPIAYASYRCVVTKTHLRSSTNELLGLFFGILKYYDYLSSTKSLFIQIMMV